MIPLLLMLASPQLSPDLLRLSQIKQVMSRNLTRLPNYNCLVTTERFTRKGPKAKFEHEDTIRLEVAEVGNSELFAWPGSGQLEDRNIRDLVPTGLIATGEFALHAHTIFMTSAPVFQFTGEETLNGRHAVRYAYKVSLFNSGYRVGLGARSALVAYDGWFWADAQTHELLRLEVNARNIPPEIGLSAASTVIDYGKVHIRAGDFLLPQEANLTAEQPSGWADRNHTRFTNCHEYVAESAIRFDASEEKAPAAATIPSETALPPGVLLHLRLETQIDSRKSATGDLITARLTKNGLLGDKIVAPSGTQVRGRIVRLMRQSPYHWLLDLDFFEVALAEGAARLHGQVERLPSSGSSRRLVRPGRLLIQESDFRLPKLDMIFVTTAKVTSVK